MCGSKLLRRHDVWYDAPWGGVQEVRTRNYKVDAIGGAWPKPRRFIEPTVCVHSGPPCCSPFPRSAARPSAGNSRCRPIVFSSFNFGDEVLA